MPFEVAAQISEPSQV